MLLLSTFSGIGMLDSGFVNAGYVVVQAPEKILGGDIRHFKSIPQKFTGVIGGSPCQSFSGLNRNPDNYSLEMLNEYCRVVVESDCDWFLLENVVRVPTVAIDGYYVQRFNLSPRDLGFEQSRPRTFQFGSKKGLILELPEPVKNVTDTVACLTASDFNKSERRTFLEFCQLQGFTTEPDLENFTQSAKYRAVGNGVHLEVSNVIARLILSATTSQNPLTVFNSKLCACGCGRIPSGSKKSYSDACRKRLEKQRKSSLVLV
jgi:DNA (cytosine-5)-methyltransferase 1